MDAAEFATIVISDQPIVAERVDVPRRAGRALFGRALWRAVSRRPVLILVLRRRRNRGLLRHVPAAVESRGPRRDSDRAVWFARSIRLTWTTTTPVDRSYVVEPRSRLTVWVAQESPLLRDTQLSTRITSYSANRRRAHPVVARRTAATWRENHAEVGAREWRPPLGGPPICRSMLRLMAGIRSCWWRRRSRISQTFSSRCPATTAVARRATSTSRQTAPRCGCGTSPTDGRAWMRGDDVSLPTHVTFSQLYRPWGRRSGREGDVSRHGLPRRRRDTRDAPPDPP